MTGIKPLVFFFGYLFAAYSYYIIIKRFKNSFLKILLFSTFYAAFFGIGTLGGGGGEPGFALPFPILGAALIYIWDWSPWNMFIGGVILPFLFWWVLILIIMLIRNKIKAEKSVKQI